MGTFERSAYGNADADGRANSCTTIVTHAYIGLDARTITYTHADTRPNIRSHSHTNTDAHAYIGGNVRSNIHIHTSPDVRSNNHAHVHAGLDSNADARSHPYIHPGATNCYPNANPNASTDLYINVDADCYLGERAYQRDLARDCDDGHHGGYGWNFCYRYVGRVD